MTTAVTKTSGGRVLGSLVAARPRLHTWGHVVPVVAGVLGLVWAVLVDRGFVNADGISYLAITEHWSAGEWSTAINGYWSPLLSLVLVPVDLVGIPLLPAVRVLQAVTAGAAIAAVQRVMRVADTDRTIASIIALGACPFAVFAAFENVTPDLLMAVLLVFFVAEFVGGLKRPVVAGLIAGAAFLAKAYALPVVVVFLLAVIVTSAVTRVLERRFAPRDVRTPEEHGVVTLRRVVTAASVFVLVVLTWSVIISVDEGRLTFSTAGDYNRVVTSPGARGNPYGWAGLIEPDDPTAFWAWEDPPRMLPNVQATQTIETADVVESAAPPSNPGRFDRQIVNVRRSIRYFAALVPVASIGALVVLTWVAVRSVSFLRASDAARRRRSLGRDTMAVWWSTLAASVYLSGLLFLVVTARYLFFVMLLAVAVSGIGLSVLSDRFPERRRAVLALTALVAALTVVRPAVELHRLDERAQAAIPLQEFLSDVDVDGKRLASSPAMLGEVGGRCLVDRCVYLGAPAGTDRDVIADQLDRFDVDVFVVDLAFDVEIPDRARLLAESADVDVAVYDVSDVESSS